jgi:hypothetical protein
MPDDARRGGSQAAHGLHGDLHPAARGNAVKNNGQLGGPADFQKMLVKPFLRRLVVIRGDLEGGVGPDGFRALGQKAASLVELAPVPAITLILPSANSTA